MLGDLRIWGFVPSKLGIHACRYDNTNTKLWRNKSPNPQINISPLFRHRFQLLLNFTHSNFFNRIHQMRQYRDLCDFAKTIVLYLCFGNLCIGSGVNANAGVGIEGRVLGAAGQ